MFCLSHLEFDIVWEQVGLGERPYPFTVGSFGETMDERAVLREQVQDALAERGLHDGRDLHPKLEDLLVLLVRNRFTIDGLLASSRVLAAGRGERGVLAVQTDDELRLEPARDVVGSVVDLLPEKKPGPGNAVSVPSALFSDAAEAYATGGYAGFERTMNRGGISGRDLRVFSTILESGAQSGGQLAANSVDLVGRRTRSPVLNWFDTTAGRYLVHTERRGGREEWLTFAPGDAGRIGQRLTALVAGVQKG
jgi:hypothetical protein